MVGWLDVFTRNEYKDLFLESLQFYQKNKGLEIHAWCILTNHGHLVFRSINDQKPELLIGDIKRFTSQSIVKSIQENSRDPSLKGELAKQSRREFLLDFFKKEAEKSSNVKHYQFSRHDNKPIELWSNKVIQQKIDYVHNNPVEEGLVYKPEDYVYSSATNYAGQKGLVDDVIVFRMFDV